MRSKFILPEDEIRALAEQCLFAPKKVPDGTDLLGSGLHPETFSQAIEARLLAFFETDSREHSASWLAAEPIAIGSWGRGELCPRSDLDLLFVGDQEAAGRITAAAQARGIKIRSRVPEDINDWTKGVEIFDVLSLLDARPLTAAAKLKVDARTLQFQKQLHSIRRLALTKIKREKQQRALRYDSVEGFLEPNIKYGPGGLRDLQQALSIRRLFPEKFAESAHADDVYSYFKKLFLLLRQRLHLAQGAGDLVSAYEQKPLAEWLGFAHPRDFMRELQKGLSRVAFYADLDLELAKRAKPRPTGAASEVGSGLATVSGLPAEVSLRRMRADPSIINQANVRRLTTKSGVGLKEVLPLIVEMLSGAVDPRTDDKLIIAMFRSRLIDVVVTDFRRVVGYVQHDQYHRYPVDTHLLQAIRELKRVYNRPTVLGRLRPIVNSMAVQDWKILGWAALYHDVGKGSGGEHSDHSVRIARKDLTKFGVDSGIVDEVLWLIERHLDLSQAAFRGNSASPKTWRALLAKGIEGARLRRLAIFTAIDIRATNREAYTPWKERLLAELVERLELPEARNLKLVSDKLGLKHGPLLERLDPFLVGALSPLRLSRDLTECLRRKETAASVACFKQPRTGRFWIRFHERQDRPGLFVAYARALQALGVSVRHASILSDESLGVYDWFEVKPPRIGPKMLESRLLALLRSGGEAEARTVAGTDAVTDAVAEVRTELPRVEFEAIDVLSEDDREWVVSFRGRDVRGALLAAAERLALKTGVSIRWAKVHTWGRQLDDVFGVTPPKGLSKTEFEAILRVS